MSQILHIFSKDVRRLWIDILLSICVVVLFAWITPKSWTSGTMHNPYQEAASVANFLLLLSWVLLIARLIHGEVLVGDKQFWITRPYERAKLLAAKALFLFAFIYLPFLFIQITVLLQAGFSPLSYVPGILYSLLLISMVFFPLVGLAAVTSNLARMALAILGVLVAFGVAVSVMASISTTNGNNSPVLYTRVPSGGSASIAVVLLVCGAVIVLQYARRQVLVARVLLGSTPFLLLLVSFICNRGIWMDRTFPPAAQTDSSIIRVIPFEQDESARKASVGGWGWTGAGHYYNIDKNKWAIIQVLLRTPEIAAGDRWQLDAFRPTLVPASGAPVKLDWQLGQEIFDNPDVPGHVNYRALEFLLPRADFERFKSSPLTLHLDLALTQARPARTWHFPLTKGDFMIPDLGSCSAIDDKGAGVLHIIGVFCRFPLKMPAVTTVRAPQTRGPCELAPAQPGDPALAISNTLGNFASAPATLRISPMEQTIFLSGPNYTNDPKLIPLRLCPGTPVDITQYRKVRTMQTSLTIENFSLSAQY
jgi:hypothetical protein